MESDNFNLLARVSQTHFRKAEGKVGALLLESPECFYQLSISEVATRSQTSEATVIRFAKVLGFSGFQSLKISLAQEVAVANDILSSGVVPTDDWQKALLKAIQMYQVTLSETGDLLLQSCIPSVLTAIESATMILITAVGTSGSAASMLQYKLSRLGYRAYYHADPHNQALQVSLLHENDVVIALSASGTTKDTVDVMRLAYEQGAKTVAVTQYAKSPLTSFAQDVLLTTGRETAISSGAVSTAISQLAVVDAIFIGLMLHHFNDANDKLRHTASTLARDRKF
ncbi:MAG: MurR/RpiR family transcriptional regulator [Acidibacillus sp.]|uniref:HTH-type transcriptional regulator MurR n=1 Tax=Sulfoacidibacillus ferrooxidans TaxID=2005001 RepID=A0A9X1V9S8_9BACL|nr:MurR/RpiR family transcriptional regulator [Sulfoacidibacillus ferrooxidans]MCI0183514.1 HTH-type transcriptional regulator MurR [Sulfoacidibacillus ferrooxidans]MCY0891986.1 MurR/RpiR family transcriptional regulator [Acidibacillus sp.]